MPLGEHERHRPRAARSPPTGEAVPRPRRRRAARAASLDGLGRPIDGMPSARPPRALRSTPAARPTPLQPRRAIEDRVALGVRALDALVPCGRGQRLGIFAGSGVGKSSLLGMIARSTAADVNVIALVGERGREVREFIERDLGDGAASAASSSSRPPTSRRWCASSARSTATAIAEHFRDQGADVHADDGLGHALRDGPARGRPGRSASRPPRAATRRACSPCCRSCSSAPARAPSGSITGLYTVLVDGDDMNEPIADAVALDPRRPRRAQRATSPTPATTRRSTCCRASRASPARSPPPRARSAAGAGCAS